MSGYETIDGIPTNFGGDTEGGGGGEIQGLNLKNEGIQLPNSPYSVMNVVGEGLTLSNVSSTEAQLAIDLSAVTREVFQAEDNLEYSTNSNIYQPKLSLVFTPIKSSEFVIMAFSEVSMDNAGQQGMIRLSTNTGSILSEVSTLIPFPSSPHDNDEWLEKTIVAKISLTKNVQYIINIDWKSLDIINTVYIRRTRILALGV